MPEIWTSENEPSFDFQKDPNDVRIECDNTQQEQTINIIVSVITHLLLAWKARYFVSDAFCAIDVLLNILHYFVSIIQFTFNCDSLKFLKDIFPGTFYKAKNMIGLNKDKFEKYVCCPICNKLFSYEDSKILNPTSSIVSSRLCDNVLYPGHVQERMRKECGTRLMKTVVSVDGKKTYLQCWSEIIEKNAKNGVVL